MYSGVIKFTLQRKAKAKQNQKPHKSERPTDHLLSYFPNKLDSLNYHNNYRLLIKSDSAITVNCP